MIWRKSEVFEALFIELLYKGKKKTSQVNKTVNQAQAVEP